MSNPDATAATTTPPAGSAPANSTTNTEPKTYTKKEVEKHDKEEDCWLIVHGKVYNVTSFVRDHPGGADVILEQAGQDATNGFENVGHSETARKQLASFYIGDVAKTTKTSSSSSKASSGDDAFSTAATGALWMKFLVPCAVVAFALYVRFFAPKV